MTSLLRHGKKKNSPSYFTYTISWSFTNLESLIKIFYMLRWIVLSNSKLATKCVRFLLRMVLLFLSLNNIRTGCKRILFMMIIIREVWISVRMRVRIWVCPQSILVDLVWFLLRDQYGYRSRPYVWPQCFANLNSSKNHRGISSVNSLGESFLIVEFNLFWTPSYIHARYNVNCICLLGFGQLRCFHWF